MSDIPTPDRVAGYHDFSGLAGLRGDAARSKQGAVRQAAEQFEAYFIQQMMKTMRDAVERSDLMDNRDADTFQDLMDKEVSVKLAQRSALGLADMLERQFRQASQEPTAHQALTARERTWPPAPAGALPVPGGPAALPLPPRTEGRAYPLKGALDE